MFKKSILAITAAAIMASAIPSTSFARDGGGSDRPYAIAKHPGKTVGSFGNKDKSRTVITVPKKGKIKIVRKPRKSRPWASSRDTRTGRTTLSVGMGRGNPRAVFQFDAFGGMIGFGISN